jgi:hypothetical protein
MGVKPQEFSRPPIFGITKILLERIHSLDEKWYVEFWEFHYYFLGIEVYQKKKEIVKHNGKNIKKVVDQ